MNTISRALLVIIFSAIVVAGPDAGAASNAYTGNAAAGARGVNYNAQTGCN